MNTVLALDPVSAGAPAAFLLKAGSALGFSSHCPARRMARHDPSNQEPYENPSTPLPAIAGKLRPTPDALSLRGGNARPGGPGRPGAGGRRMMDSAILSLLGAFLLSIIGLFVFIWSFAQRAAGRKPGAASVIFARGEIGRVDDPALPDDARGCRCSRRRRAWHRRCTRPTPAELQDRITVRPVERLSRSSCSSPLPVSGCCSGSLAGLDLFDQAAPARLADRPGLADLWPHPHGAPERGALWLDHQCRAGHGHLAAAAPAAHAAGRRHLGHARRRADERRASPRHRRHSARAGPTAWNGWKFPGRSASCSSSALRW